MTLNFGNVYSDTVSGRCSCSSSPFPSCRACRELGRGSGSDRTRGRNDYGQEWSNPSWAKVTLLSLDTGIAQTGMSNGAGDFAFNLVPIGRYSFSVSMAAFEAFKVNEITLAAGDRLRVNAGMVPGRVSQTVEVSTGASSAQTDSSTVGSLIDAQNLYTQTVVSYITGRNGFYNFKRLDGDCDDKISAAWHNQPTKASKPV